VQHQAVAISGISTHATLSEDIDDEAATVVVGFIAQVAVQESQLSLPSDEFLLLATFEDVL